MKTSKVLLKAMDVIATPDKWTKGSFARDINQNSTSADEPDAACWCALGAIQKATKNSKASADASLYLVSVVETNVPIFNDYLSTTHDKVMEKFMTATFLALANGD